MARINQTRDPAAFGVDACDDQQALFQGLWSQFRALGRQIAAMERHNTLTRRAFQTGCYADITTAELALAPARIADYRRQSQTR